MAVDVNTANRSSTIAFTLPISCQICLGKVKSPVLCPNNHVFCSPCLATWLDRNQQCPACRTPIDQQNPYKEIRGGMSVCEEDGSATMRSAEMRRARFEMLFKDYESELSLTQAKMEALKVENTALQHQLEVTKSSQSHGSEVPVFKQPDLDALAAVTKKLEDVTELCSKLKQELSKYKKRNEDMKEENDMLLRENQRLRMEITSRSPHRYGRTTVAALQSQIDSYEKEVQQLNKALEKSDGYIEDLEQELSAFRGNQEPTKRSSDSKPSERLPQSSVVKKPTHKKQLFVGDNDEPAALNKPGISQEKPKADSVVSPQKAKNGILVSSDSKESVDSPTKGGKKVTFSLPGESTPQGSQASSFDLEYPSPFSQSSDVSEGKPVKSTSDQPTVVLFRIPEQPALKKQTQMHQDISFVPHKETNTEKSTKHEPSKNESKPLNDSANIESELDELDISVTPELKDCMKLFNLAERNVHERESFGGAPKSDCLPEQPSPASKRLNFDSCEVSSSSDRKYPSVLPNPTCSASSSGTVPDQVDYQTQQERVKKASKSSSRPSNQSSSSTGGYFVHEPPPILGQHHMGSLINKTGSEASSPGLRTSNFKFRDSAMGPFKSQIGTPPVSVTSVSHSVASNVLGSSFQTALPSSTSYFTPGSVTTTSLLPQTFSKSASSGAALKQGPVDSTTHAASLSNSLLLNSKTTESLASSLNKLEQTLATHRSTRINIPKPGAYEQPMPGFSNPFPVISTSSSVQYPSVGLSTIRPGIPATNQTLSSYVPLGPPLFSMGGVHQFPNPAPPSIKNISAASQYDTLSMSYPSAQQLSSSILGGQTSTSQSGPVNGYSGVPGRSASASSVPFCRAENSVKASSSSMVLERPNEYSYVTNSSLNSNDLSSLDSSFLPEPKKRLFETDTDDTDVSLSPMKSSKLR